MSCQSTRLLETNFSSSKRLPPYLQYDKELFASWLCHTLLTGLQNPHTFPIDHHWDIRNLRFHDLYSFPAATLPKRNASWLNSGNAFHRGWGYKYIHGLLLSVRKMLIECIDKDGGHTNDLKYINFKICNHNMFMSTLYFFSTKQLNWGVLLFISMIIVTMLELNCPKSI